MLRIGIHGLGFMGMMHYLAYQKVSGVKVTAICETLPERRNGDWTKIKGNFGPQGTMTDLTGIAVYADAADLFADPNVDVVDICLPPNQHAPMSIAALQSGKHVFCEKPITLSLDDAEEMTAAAKEAKKILMVGHVLPFFPAYAFVYDAVMSFRYGALLGGHFDRVISEPVWLKNFYDMSTIGGPLLDLHIHDAHFIRLLFGMPQKVQCVGRLRNDVPEYFNSQFLFSDPFFVVTSTSGCIYQQGRPFMARSEVHFAKATIVIDGSGTTVLTNDGKVTPAELPALDEVGIFAAELQAAANAFQQNQVLPMLGGTMARDALAIAMMEMAAIRQNAYR